MFRQLVWMVWGAALGVALFRVVTGAGLRRLAAGPGELPEAVRAEERRRLRCDLHDGIGPMLAATALQLQTARRLMHRDPEAADAVLAGLLETTAAAIEELRRVVDGLRPASLDRRDLVAAVEQQARTVTGHDALHVAVQATGDLASLPGAVEVGAFRIISEAVQNVYRHAQARTCTVRLARGRMLEIEVADDGGGLSRASSAGGVGLESMRRRAADLGGTLVVESTPARGTRVVARLPLRVGSEAAA